MNLLHDYLACTAHTIAPPVFRSWCGVGVIAAALGRDTLIKVAPDHDPLHGWKLRPNFYIILVGQRDSGKSVAISQARSFMRDLGVPLAPNISSQARFFEIMEENDGLLTVCEGEIGVFLHSTHTGKQTADHALLQQLCKMFDLDDFAYETRGGANVAMELPFLSILGATTPSSLHRMLPHDTHGEGFLSRTLLVFHHQPVLKLPGAHLDMPLRADILKRLERIQKFPKTIVFSSEATAAYLAWNQQQFDAHKDATNEVGARLPDYVTRLAAVYAASDLTTTVSEGHFALAAQHIEELLPGMRSVLRTTLGNPMSSVMEGVLQHVENGGIARAAYFDAYRDYGGKKQLEGVLQLLQAAERIKVTGVAGKEGGRRIVAWDAKENKA